MHSFADAKSNALLHTHIRLMLHLSAPPEWQYTLDATHPSMNQHTASSRHYHGRTPPHRFLKRTTQCLLNHKMTHCSTYTTPDFLQHSLPLLPYAKASIPTNIRQSNPANQPPTYHFDSLLNTTPTQKPACACHTLYSMLHPFNCPPLPRNAQRCSSQIHCSA